MRIPPTTPDALKGGNASVKVMGLEGQYLPHHRHPKVAAHDPDVARDLDAAHDPDTRLQHGVGSDPCRSNRQIRGEKKTVEVKTRSPAQQSHPGSATKIYERIGHGMNKEREYTPRCQPCIHFQYQEETAQ